MEEPTAARAGLAVEPSVLALRRPAAQLAGWVPRGRLLWNGPPVDFRSENCLARESHTQPLAPKSFLIITSDGVLLHRVANDSSRILLLQAFSLIQLRTFPRGMLPGDVSLNLQTILNVSCHGERQILAGSAQRPHDYFHTCHHRHHRHSRANLSSPGVFFFSLSFPGASFWIFEKKCSWSPSRAGTLIFSDGQGHDGQQHHNIF